MVPGLHDHHIHLLALAAARRSVVLGPPTVTDAATFDAVVRAAAASGTGWVRGIGYHETVAGPLDRDRLDALAPHRPARVQHRSGSMWVLNTAAIDAAGIDGLFVDGIERDERVARAGACSGSTTSYGPASGRSDSPDPTCRPSVGSSPATA